MTVEDKRPRPNGGLLREAVEKAKAETEGMDAADIAAEALQVDRREIRPQLREEMKGLDFRVVISCLLPGLLPVLFSSDSLCPSRKWAI